MQDVRRWIRVVTELSGRRDRVVTAFPAVPRSLNGRAPAMTFHVGPHEFDHVVCDKEGDVLYLADE